MMERVCLKENGGDDHFAFGNQCTVGNNGKVSFYGGLRFVRDRRGQRIARNACWILVHDPNGRVLETYEVPIGATLLVTENQDVRPEEVLCRWDPSAIPIIAEAGGRVHLEYLDGRYPRIVLEDKAGKIIDSYHLPERTNIKVTEGHTISAGTLLASLPREMYPVQGVLTSPLEWLTELFEARKPRDPSVIAEIDGTVELLGEKRRGKRTIIVSNEAGIEREHYVPDGKYLLVRDGDCVRAGENLIAGFVDPHDILPISGEEATQAYLVREIQNVYRHYNVKINDKHIEIIVSQMLRWGRVERIGDTMLLPGSIMDRFEFLTVNQKLTICLKIVYEGDSHFRKGDILATDEVEQVNADITARGGDPARGETPALATVATQLFGITEATLRNRDLVHFPKKKKNVSVVTMAKMVNMRPSQFRYMLQVGEFPWPMRDEATGREFYPPNLQAECVELWRNVLHYGDCPTAGPRRQRS